MRQDGGHGPGRAATARRHPGLSADGPDDERLMADVERLHHALDAAEESSALLDQPSAAGELHDLLVRARLSRYAAVVAEGTDMRWLTRVRCW